MYNFIIIFTFLIVLRFSHGPQLIHSVPFVILVYTCFLSHTDSNSYCEQVWKTDQIFFHIGISYESIFKINVDQIKIHFITLF